MLRLALLPLALGLAACDSGSSDDDVSDAECGPVTGTIAVADSEVSPDLAQITPDEAGAAAVASAPGAVVTDVDLDEEDGFLVYEVDLLLNGAELDVIVDAGTGAVLCSARD